MNTQELDDESELSTEDALELLGRECLKPLDGGEDMPEFGHTLIAAAQEMRDLRAAASRLSEMEAEIKRLREALREDETVGKMYAALCGARHALDLLMGDTDPDEETPAVLAMQAIQNAIELADARAALEQQP